MLKNLKKVAQLSFCSLLLFIQSTQAQERSLLTVAMKNGDAITGYSDITMIPFSTDYGNLALPVRKVNKVVLGINSDGIDRDQLNEQLDKIMFGSLDEAERAFDRLVVRDERILPLIRDYLQAPDYQSRNYNPFNVELLYQIMLEKYDLEKDFSEEDIIYYDDMHSAEGNYKFEFITLETNYGELVIDRSFINEIKIQLLEEDLFATKTFKLLADVHIAANKSNGWLKTGVLVKKGDDFSINSEGEVTLESLDGNTYTPDGGVNGSDPPQENGPIFGTVIFKIGEKGAIQTAGDNFDAIAESTGIIYLSIYESVYNSGNRGHYISKVRIKQVD